MAKITKTSWGVNFGKHPGSTIYSQLFFTVNEAITTLHRAMQSCLHIWSGGFLRLTLFRRWRTLRDPWFPHPPLPLLLHLSALTVESSVGSSTLSSFTAAMGVSACPGADVAMPCDAPPSATLSPKANRAPSPSIWGGSGDGEQGRPGTGTDKVMSVGEVVAEVGMDSGTWQGLWAAMGGGASSQGASTHCTESCALSAGGCTDSHTQTQLKTCILQAILESNKKKKFKQSTLNWQHKSCKEAGTDMPWTSNYD